LDGPKVAGASVDQGRLGSAQGMRAEHFWIKSNACHPIGKKSGVLTGGHGPGRGSIRATTNAGSDIEMTASEALSSDSNAASVGGIFILL
jgi:hypothetical protein